MSRHPALSLASTDWNALSTATRHIQDAIRTTSTGALGALQQHMRDAMAYARPIEIDQGMARLMREQLAAYRDMPKLDLCTDSLRLHVDRALQLPRAERVLTALASTASAKLDEEARDMATLRDQIAGLSTARQLARQTARELEFTAEVLRKQLAQPLNHIADGVQKYFTETVGALDVRAMVADTVDVRSLLRTVRGAAAYLDRLNMETLAPDADGFARAEDDETDIGAIRTALAEVGLETGGTIDLEALQRAIHEAVKQATKTPAKVAVLRWLLKFVQQLLVAVLVAYAFAPRGTRIQSPRVVQRQVSIVARHLSTDPATLARLRIVLKPDLSVYRHRSRKSGSTNTLRLGEVVILVERRRNWTRVEWTDDGTTLRGWVFTRYLGRIQPEKVPPKNYSPPPDWTCD